jgi:hypothetical protein
VDLPAPRLRFSVEVRVDVGPPRHVGRGPGEVLEFVPITGGTVDGPDLSGSIVPGGGDWMITRGDTIELDARYLIEADDGALVDVVNHGYFRADPAQVARLDAGEAVPEGEYYFRTSPRFRTDAPRHAWLAGHVFVGLAREEERQIRIRFFVVE